MLNPKRMLILLVLLASAVLFPAAWPAAASGPQQAGDQPLKVAVEEAEPFVVQKGDKLTGFSIDVWKEVATRIGRPFEFVVVKSVGEQLAAVEQGDADIGIAAITMTSKREASLDFSHGYYASGLQIMTARRGRLDILKEIAAVLPGLLAIIGVLMLIVVVFAHLVWLSERKNHPQVSPSYWRGVGDCFWFAIVTLTTVGYGDITPKTRLGKVFGVIWMFVGLFLIASFTATVASHLTVVRLQSTIRGLDDLAGKQVITVQNTAADDFLTEQGIRHTGAVDLDSACQQLADGGVDAVVYDEPLLAYYLATSHQAPFDLVGPSFNRQMYGIAVPKGSEYRKKIDIALLELFEDGTLDELHKKWFGQIL